VSPPFSIAVMADGAVGRETVAILLEDWRPYLACIVVSEGSPHAEAIRAEVQAAAPVFRWGNHAGLAALAPQVLVLAWWPHILGDRDLALAPVILNMHPSLLPHGRGKDPNFWAIVDSELFGVTIHHVDASVDGGPIAFQRAIPVDWESTGETLYRAAEREMVDLFRESMLEIAAGRIPKEPQDPSEGSFHRRAELDTASHIMLDAPTTARNLLNKLRARTFPPFPACHFDDRGVTYEVSISIRKKR
jgi:methionyl-tRNA formyltransferase